MTLPVILRSKITLPKAIKNAEIVPISAGRVTDPPLQLFVEMKKTSSNELVFLIYLMTLTLRTPLMLFRCSTTSSEAGWSISSMV